MIRAIVFASLLVACNDPPLTVKFRVTSGDEAACFVDGHKVTACDEVTMSCDVIVSLRVFPPNDPTSPVMSLCQPPIGERDLCSIASLDLPPPNYQIDEQTLEVQILVYQAKQIPQVARDQWQCPADVMFNAQGFPIASVAPCVGDGVCDPLPAIGGVAFYQPGDVVTVVDLGCVDYDLLNDATCTGASSTSVAVAIWDFSTQVAVSSSVADSLTVSAGTPRPVTDSATGATHYRFLGSDETELTRDQSKWSGSVATPLQPACIDVSEDVAQGTAAVRCFDNSAMASSLDVIGIRLSVTELDEILAAIGSPGVFPSAGLTVGVVLDEHLSPRANAQVTTSCTVDEPCTVQYLDMNRTGVVTTGTTNSGIFVSRDAPFGTTFSATTSSSITAQIGGKIDQRVTVVVLTDNPQTNN